jgi:hypothetical protein
MVAELGPLNIVLQMPLAAVDESGAGSTPAQFDMFSGLREEGGEQAGSMFAGLLGGAGADGAEDGGEHAPVSMFSGLLAPGADGMHTDDQPPGNMFAGLLDSNSATAGDGPVGGGSMFAGLGGGDGPGAEQPISIFSGLLAAGPSDGGGDGNMFSDLLTQEQGSADGNNNMFGGADGSMFAGLLGKSTAEERGFLAIESTFL